MKHNGSVQSGLDAHAATMGMTTRHTEALAFVEQFLQRYESAAADS